MVLLGLITGRKPVGNFGEGLDIVQWTKIPINWSKEGVVKILDNRLRYIFTPSQSKTGLFGGNAVCSRAQRRVSYNERKCPDACAS